MRHIERLAEPGILTKKKNQWLADFLASGKNQYCVKLIFNRL